MRILFFIIPLLLMASFAGAVSITLDPLALNMTPGSNASVNANITGTGNYSLQIGANIYKNTASGCVFASDNQISAVFNSTGNRSVALTSLNNASTLINISLSENANEFAFYFYKVIAEAGYERAVVTGDVRVNGTSAPNCTGSISLITNDIETSASVPTVIDTYTETGTNISINTNGTASGSVTVSKYTENPVNSTSGTTLKVAGKYIDIVVSDAMKSVLTNATIRIYYTDAELAQAGISEESLAIYYWNETAGAWQSVGGTLGYDSNGKYISIVVNHFSLYGLFGSAPVAAAVAPVPAPPAGGYTLTLSMTAPSEISVDAGASKSFDVIVNANHLAAGASLSASGVPQSWMTITPSSADIPANGNQKYTVTVNVPAGQSGARTLTLTATSGSKSASQDVNIAINAPAVTPAQPGATNPPAGNANVPAGRGPTGMFLGVENTTWYGAIIGVAIIGLLVYAFKKGKIKIPGKSGFKYGFKK